MKPQANKGKIPVTLLSGFLGAGKTTLLKHILHTKHSENRTFRCAVIVNDMAELNIDHALVEKSAVIQSDDVVAMQNGCVCCSLQSDLVEQVTQLATSAKFDYMIIECSGVSEPAQIAKLFANCEDSHDNNKHAEKPILGDIARLDTCVTVVDVSNMLEERSLWLGPSNENLFQLLVEQIEYSNVVLLNKSDLVDKEQLHAIQFRVSLLNPEAILIPCQHSQIPVMEVLDTHLYDSKVFDGLLMRLDGAYKAEKVEKSRFQVVQESCCIAKTTQGLMACCPTKTPQPLTIPSKLSNVTLPVAHKTRHSTRFGLTSFLYHARRPFHPERFCEAFLEKYFIQYDPEHSDPNSENEDRSGVLLQDDSSPEQKRSPEELQSLARDRQFTRANDLGQLLRSKGFLWLADAHDLKTTFNHAGNMVTLDARSHWTVLDSKSYLGTRDEKSKLRKDWVAPWGDRRQELVFIGQNLNHKFIQTLLDECLLTDQEFEMGVDYWKATIGDAILDINPQE